MCKRKWEETIAEVRKRLNNGRELQYKECLHLRSFENLFHTIFNCPNVFKFGRLLSE